jgi:D-alanyl-D-alanine carboxypeptidase (penicillin-binding protein 5/6)
MKNYFLLVTGSPDGITGGKTGTWDDDDCAVVCSFSEAGIDAVIVVLGDTKRGRPKDVRKLMAFSHEVTPGYIVPAPGSTVESVMVKHGEKTRTTLVSDGVTYAYPEDNNVREIRTELEHDSLEAPVRKGQEVGKLLIYCGDELIGEHKLLASEDIDTGWLPSYLYISNQAVLNALKVLGIFVVLLVLINMIGSRISTGGKKKSASPKVSGTGRTGTYNHEGGTARKSSRKEKKETRKRLREKYREKH